MQYEGVTNVKMRLDNARVAMNERSDDNINGGRSVMQDMMVVTMKDEVDYLYTSKQFIEIWTGKL
jgi:hypothetical protein